MKYYGVLISLTGIFICLMLVGGFISCNEENAIIEEDDTPSIISQKRFVTSSSVAVSDIGLYKWKNGDQIAVIFGGGIYCYNYDKAIDDSMVSFVTLKYERNFQKDSVLFFIYPYESLDTATDQGLFLNFPDVQFGNNGELNPNNLVLLSRLNNLSQDLVQISPIQGFLKIEIANIDDIITSIEISGNNNETLCGEAIINYDGDFVGFSDNATNGKSIKFINEEVGAVESYSFIICLPPIELENGFKLSISTKSGKTVCRSYEDSYVVLPNSFRTVSLDTKGTEILSFSLSDGEKVYPSFLIKDTDIHVSVPNDCVFSSFKTLCDYNGASFSLAPDSKDDYSDFNNPVRFIVRSINGEEKEWTVHIYNLPVIVIDTPNNTPIDSRDKRVEGCVIVQVNEGGTIDSLGTAGIKGRGNATWTQSNKKPYNVKLDKKSSILGMSKSKHWTMLANALYDRSQLHNAVALYFASLTDYSWTPKGQFCEVLLNGKHLGLYYICEKIRVEKGKIDITEIGPNDLSGVELTGGYMIESTIYPEQAEGIYFSMNNFNMSGGYPLYWFYDLPDGEESEVPKEQQDYIRGRLDYLESLIYNNDSLSLHRYVDYLDIESLINWFLVEEVCQNEEASRTKNVRLYKDRGDEHFYMGPPWDFDAWTFGYTDYNRWLTKDDALWLKQLFQDPLFVERVKEKWNHYKPQWETTGLNYMNQQYNRIYKAAKRNDTMWPDWVGNYSTMTFEEAVVQMRDAINHRIQWMDERIQSW